MSSILIGHSYFLRFDPKLWRAMHPYPPLGTLYAAALLRQAGHEVHLFDATLASSTDGWAQLLREHRSDVAVLFEDNFDYLSKMCLLNMRHAAFEMIDMAAKQSCPVIVSGADVTDHAGEYIEHGASFAVIGEGDQTVVDLVDTLAKGTGRHEAIPGVVFLTPRGKLASTPSRPVITDLDSLPAPARDLIDLALYRRAWQRHGRFSMNIVTSRGCSFHCNWCAKPIWGQRHNVRSPISVADEIEDLLAMGAEHLWFMDDILGIKPGWLAELADTLGERGLRAPFKCLSRADLLLRPGEVNALSRAGCETVWLGAESGSQKILDAMEKGITTDQAVEATRRLKQAGIRPAFFLQFGYPGEDWQDVQATFQLVRDCEPDDIGMSVSYPLPGTPFYQRVRDSMTGPGNWSDSEEMAMLYKGPYSTAFYHRVHSALHAEFRIRKATGGTGLLRSILRLFGQRRPRSAALLLKDTLLLPLHRLRLDQERRRSPRHGYELKPALSQAEAALPSPQEQDGEADRLLARPSSSRGRGP